MTVPGQQLVDPVNFMLGNAAENIGEPSLRIDFVELRGLDQRVGSSSGTAASFGPGEEPIFTTYRYAPHIPFCSIVVDAQAAILEIGAQSL